MFIETEVTFILLTFQEKTALQSRTTLTFHEF